MSRAMFKAAAACAVMVCSTATAVLPAQGYPSRSLTTGNWVNASPATSPSPRYGAAFAFDAETSQLILYGGRTATTYAAGDTWSWNGKRWVRLEPKSSPPALFAAEMAYDATTHQLVMFGGWLEKGKANDETWCWTGTTWLRESPATSPPPLIEPSIVWDASTSQLLLFGGGNVDTSALSSATWLWIGETWRELHPFTSPPANLAGSLAYDPTTQNVVLFGGLVDKPSGYTSATWNWNGTDWVKASQKVAPEPRYAAAMAFDPLSKEMILFGGAIGGGYITYSGTWQWDGNNWAQLYPETVPTTRAAEMMAFDPSTDQLVMFGGSSSKAGFLNDTWEWAY